MVQSNSLRTLKTYVEMITRYRIWSICGIIVVCSLIWFASPEAGNRGRTVSIVAVMFFIGFGASFIAVPMLNKQIAEIEADENKRKNPNKR